MHHNDGVQTLETLVSPAVEEGTRGSPAPATPVIGPRFILAASPTGAWAGNLATYTSGGWRFVTPIEGLTAFVRFFVGVGDLCRAAPWELGLSRGSNVTIAGQQVVGGRAAAIPDPSGGGVVDVEARPSIGQILAALRQHELIET